MILQIGHGCLKGKFFQHDVRSANEPLYVSEYDYALYRVSLPIWARLRIPVGIPPFQDYKWPMAALQSAIPGTKEPY
jgi:hypothetical protein